MTRRLTFAHGIVAPFHSPLSLYALGLFVGSLVAGGLWIGGF